MTPLEIIVLAMAGLGTLMMLISAFGIVRLRGVHQRMHAASIGASLGIMMLLLSAGLYYIDSAQSGRMVLLVLFFFITSPIATTAIARAAYRKQYDRVSRHIVHDDMADPRYLPDYAREEQEASHAHDPGVVYTDADAS